jgi:hypothetical protein
MAERDPSLAGPFQRQQRRRCLCCCLRCHSAGLRMQPTQLPVALLLGPRWPALQLQVTRGEGWYWRHLRLDQHFLPKRRRRGTRRLTQAVALRAEKPHLQRRRRGQMQMQTRRGQATTQWKPPRRVALPQLQRRRASTAARSSLRSRRPLETAGGSAQQTEVAQPPVRTGAATARPQGSSSLQPQRRRLRFQGREHKQ